VPLGFHILLFQHRPDHVLRPVRPHHSQTAGRFFADVLLGHALSAYVFDKCRQHMGLFRPGRPCAGYAHFCSTPRTIERAIGSRTVLSAAGAAVRRRDSLCTHNGRITNSRRCCGDYSLA